MAEPTIKKGSKGGAVRKAQRRLKARGYDPGPVDGLFGGKTERAVKYYQLDRNLTSDGIVGPQTWARLDPPTVRRGSTGDAVRLAQELLTSYGYDPGPVDGDFEAKTEQAVKQFQADYGLEDDGIVGVETWAALWS